MVQTSTSQKNIWVAASDGDLERVKQLIQGGLSPNVKDSNSYSPMHAAASYAHLDLLAYLLSVGGDINLPDDEGETPLFTVETMEAAQFLVEHGANVAQENEEGVNAADFLQEDHPEIAAYLRTLLPSSTTSQPAVTDEPAQPSALAVDNYASQQTSTLLQETQRIMQEAEATGENPDEKLREVVERAVRDGLTWTGSGEGEIIEGLTEDIKRRREE